MNRNILGIIAAAIGFLVFNAAFTVPEGTQAFITEFGKIKGKPITQPGLHFKYPFVEDVRYFDKRILQWDGDAEQIPTKDKKYIWVDTTARWRISDPVKFAQTVQNERSAANRLDGILDGVTRDAISAHNLVETVRNSNKIIARIAEIKEKANKKSIESGNDIEFDVSGEIEPIKTGREELTKIIILRARKELNEIGIALLDVQLRRVSYVRSVEQKVYERMISERKKIAEKIRSFGKGEEAKIRGRLSLKLKEIESIAYRKSQQIKGSAEAFAIKTYASSLGRDPGFYEFMETLDSYKSTLKNKSKMILSTKFKYLNTMDKALK
ncbi:protease modulator HflC [bacterium]|nr:protease modulator HflC [bacterium]